MEPLAGIKPTFSDYETDVLSLYDRGIWSLAPESNRVNSGLQPDALNHSANEAWCGNPESNRDEQGGNLSCYPLNITAA